MSRLVVASALVVVLLGAPAASAGQDPAEFTPRGYEFCGWKNLSEGTWTYGDPEPGAFTRAFAHRMSCTAARRNVDRIQSRRGRPHRPGYRCRTLRRGEEFADIRCVKVGGERKFRWQFGA